MLCALCDDLRTTCFGGRQPMFGSCSVQVGLTRSIGGHSTVYVTGVRISRRD
jgi:hypothetical protein